MASNKSVTVLAPNGRRQNVKITPNTTILQVLEEVCQKQGYASKKWDLKHFNTILDVNSIFRFTGLPNNAQLEMTPRPTEREMSVVTIGIQLENGQRLMGDFNPDTSLNEIINTLCSNEQADDTVIVYMHQELHGRDNLEKTTLQSLGLNSGRAMLRLIHRDLNKLNTQAHVAGQLNSKPSKSSDKERGGKNSQKSSGTSVTDQIKKAINDPLALLRSEKSDKGHNKNGGNKSGGSKKMPGSGHVLGRGESKIETAVQAEEHAKVETGYEQITTENDAMETNQDTHSDIVNEPIDFLGERNALVFNQAGAQAVPHEDLPDNFFDLTVDDAKSLLRDAKRQRDDIEGAPLTTNAQRKLERDRATLNKLHKYRRTILRIQFPNQMVLQGIFGPLETVQMVKDFVKGYLADSEQDFTLYCTPPKKNLTPQSRLIDENLVPSAIIYYSGPSELKADLNKKLVDPKIASVHAIKSRIAMTRNDPDNSGDSNANIEPETIQIRETIQNNSVPSSSSGEGSNVFNTDRIKNYTPKWFKNAFK
ncbi:tether containing UBX domain for GLUT4 [Microplitis demolitor]|uniref:tether containing UBX domain for GLUT4 n=1 Tax=Microplitis demolitor TaxID=69319 RepID=UPI0004CD706C|nr:tether containing UBX domain for GLUT4 [Microplitis demolitor]XP_008543250.1 tether containing UBX domain for GLUT4 [Microplitis demolitor]